MTGRWLALSLLGCVPSSVAAQAASYTRIRGDDWTSYRSTEALRAARLFRLPNRGHNANDLVDLVPDRTFGWVARITQPVTDGYGVSPELRQRFPVPLDRVWFRWTMRYSPGWTTAGATPPGHNNAYKIAFILWADGVSYRQELVWANTRQYLAGLGQRGVTIRETPLPGRAKLGFETTEWDGTEWWEFVMYFERRSSTSGRWCVWRRTLTQGGRIVNNPYIFDGAEFIAVSGTLARAGGIALGVNKNKGTAVQQYIYWGPWEVVDGSVYPNPFRLPNVN